MDDKWFSEFEAMWPGQRFSLQIEEVLFHEKSNYQDVLVFQSTTYGKVLVLDGIIQVTERDEFSYQEMLTHLPCFSHPNPKRVLIVGGGDGGVLREVAKHSCVQKIDMCEIDSMVCEISRRFGFCTATAFDDPRLTLVHEDASKFVKRDGTCHYDVIIVDSSDPIGPAAALFEPIFFNDMKSVLNSGGIIATQGQCIWLDLELICKVLEFCNESFDSVDYASASVPTYTSGQIGFVILSNIEQNLSVPVREVDDNMAESLRYYSSRVHQSSFVLPAFVEKEICKSRKRM